MTIKHKMMLWYSTQINEIFKFLML